MQRAIKTARSLVSARLSVCSEEFHLEQFSYWWRRRGEGVSLRGDEGYVFVVNTTCCLSIVGPQGLGETIFQSLYNE